MVWKSGVRLNQPDPAYSEDGSSFLAARRARFSARKEKKADKISASSAERPWESARQTAALRRTKASPDG